MGGNVGKLIEVGNSEGSDKVDGSSSDGGNKADNDSDSFVVAVFLFFYF